MKAVVLRSPGEIAIEERPEPEASGSGRSSMPISPGLRKTRAFIRTPLQPVIVRLNEPKTSG